jgi:hypothetical protein
MTLPDEVTLYDRLLLGLRKKDFIATFNWDPLLIQAYLRNRHLGELPEIVFLHGNVGIGVCKECKTLGYAKTLCNTCFGPRERVKLLYPIEKKNYADDEVIADQWTRFRNALTNAYYLTVFGYSAPVSDEEAINGIKKSWKENPLIELADVEIMNTADPDSLEKSWEPFFVRSHYLISDSLDHSRLMRYPRRSGESLYQASMMLAPMRDDPMPQFKDLEQLWAWVQPLIEEEVAAESRGADFSLLPPKRAQSD